MIRILMISAFSCVLLLGACQTTEEKPAEPLTAGETKSFLKKSKDPRHFWLTEYPTDYGTYFANANRLHPEQIAVLPFMDAEDNIPVVEMTSRHETKIPALLDTTARESWIDLRYVSDFDLVPLGPSPFQRFPGHVEDMIPGYACAGSRLVFDTLHMETPVFYVRAARGLFWPLSRHPQLTEVRAVIGCSMWKVFSYVQFDFINDRVLLASSREYIPHEDLVIATAELKWQDGVLTTEGTINGEPYTMLIDIAGDYELAVDQPETAVIRHVSVGDMVFRKVGAETIRHLGLGGGATPRIGLRLLAPFSVVLDNRAEKIYFEKPPELNR